MIGGTKESQAFFDQGLALMETNTAGMLTACLSLLGSAAAMPPIWALLEEASSRHGGRSIASIDQLQAALIEYRKAVKSDVKRRRS